MKVTQPTGRAMLVTYLPAGVVEAGCARAALDALLGEAPVARVLGTTVTPAIG